MAKITDPAFRTAFAETLAQHRTAAPPAVTNYGRCWLAMVRAGRRARLVGVVVAVLLFVELVAAFAAHASVDCTATPVDPSCPATVNVRVTSVGGDALDLLVVGVGLSLATSAAVLIAQVGRR